MNRKMLLMALIVLGLLFVASTVFAQSLPSGYDEDVELDTISVNTEGAGTTFVQDLEEIRRRRINEIIEKIRQGDPNVLRFVVYDVMEEVHREVIRRARVNNTNFYAVLNMSNAIPALIGGFDNQDPKLRLRFIGYLGDWVDEIGTDLADIQKRTTDRLVSRIETREEVRYGLRLLYLKIVRKTTLNRIYNGDEKVLETITPEEFIVLIHNELFLREVYCIPRNIQVRSIRLAPWWINVRAFDSVVAERLRFTSILNPRAYDDLYCVNISQFLGTDDPSFLNIERERQRKATDDRLILPLLPTGYDFYRLKILSDDPEDGREFESLKTYYYNLDDELTYFYGYKDHAGRWDIQSLYDIRYFSYSETGEVFDNEDLFVRALFGGLRNKHLVVRENSVRILLLLSDPYVKVDYSGRVVGARGILEQVAGESLYVETAINAWEDVRFSQFVDVARPTEEVTTGGNRMLTYYNTDGVIIDYSAGIGAGTVTSSGTRVIGGGSGSLYFEGSNAWGYCWNYRIDVHELLRRMGLGMLFGCEEEERVVTPPAPVVERTYFIESLFDLTTIDVDFLGASKDEYVPWDLIPDWHGLDEIEHEIFRPRP